MKKLLLLPLILIIVGSAYALVGNLFPDTTLPRIPTDPGTIGDTLTKWFGPNLDTDLPINTLALSGISATGYISSTDATCSSDQTWRGVTSDGKIICRAPLLAIGEIYE